MPELPEVETTRRGLEPHLKGSRIERVVVRESRLRWPIARDLASRLEGSTIHKVDRRGKYLLLGIETGWLIVHLGMSGSLRLLSSGAAVGKHDHFDLLLSTGMLVRLTDPRRFSAILFAGGVALSHPLLASLAPEPLDAAFSPEWLHARLRGRNAPIKTLLMNNHIVTGVGNIYANEALFLARIHPRTAGHRVGSARCARLVQAIRETLRAAIAAGGSSLRNFVGSDGKPGYFQQRYCVYAREGEPCRICSAPIRAERIGQRSAFFCPRCQR